MRSRSWSASKARRSKSPGLNSFVASFVLPALAPAVLVGVLLAVSWRAWTRDVPERGQGPGGAWLGALAFAGAHAVGHVLLRDGLPAAPWSDRVLSAQAWLFWIVLAAGLVATFEATRRAGSLAVWCVRLPLAVATIALVLRVKLTRTWEGGEAALYGGGLFLWMVAAWEGISRAGRRPGPALPIVMVLAISGLAVATGLSGSAFLAQLAGATAAGFGAAAVVAWRARRVTLDGGAVSVAWVALFGIGLCATFFNELPGTSALAFAAVPLALGLAELPAVARRPLAAGLVRYGLTLALVTIGTGLAVAAYEPDPYGY